MSKEELSKKKSDKEKQQSSATSTSSSEEESSPRQPTIELRNAAEKAFKRLEQSNSNRVFNSGLAMQNYIERLEEEAGKLRRKVKLLKQQLMVLNTQRNLIKEAIDRVPEHPIMDEIKMPTFITKSLLQTAIKAVWKSYEENKKEEEQLKQQHKRTKPPPRRLNESSEDEEIDVQPRDKMVKKSIPPTPRNQFGQVLMKEEADALEEPTEKYRFCLGRFFDLESCLYSKKFTSHNELLLG